VVATHGVEGDIHIGLLILLGKRQDFPAFIMSARGTHTMPHDGLIAVFAILDLLRFNGVVAASHTLP